MKTTNTILDDIIANKLIEITEAKKQISLEQIKQHISQRKTEVRDFYHALKKHNSVSIIAEIKQSSPSKGLLKKDFDVVAIAEEYQTAGVDAISVLTDKKYFQGDLAFIQQVKEVTNIPILRKDFIIDEYQVYESFLAEADAILLIVAALEKEQIVTILNTANKLGLFTIVEVHTQEELALVLDIHPQIIGVNARDLKTFQIDKTLFHDLLPHISEDILKIAESGVEDREDIENARIAGAQAVLIGSSLMQAKNIEIKLQELKGEAYGN